MLTAAGIAGLPPAVPRRKNGLTVMFRVERTRDGRSFISRTVQAYQENRIIFTMICQFQRPETGPSFQVPANERLHFTDFRLGKKVRKGGLPQPEQLLKMGDAEAYDDFSGSIARIVVGRGKRWVLVWGKHINSLTGAAGTVPADEWKVHAAVLTYMSDFSLAESVFLPHLGNGFVPHSSSASLDHSIHFHRPFRVDDWLLTHVETTVSDGARGLARAEIFDRSGRLVVSLTQEVLVRPMVQAPDGGQSEL